MDPAFLRRHVEALAGEIGERNVFRHDALTRAAEHIEGAFAASGCAVRRHLYDVEGRPCANLDVEIPGGPEIVVVGAHYDSVDGSPGANDNATGAAAVLALARAFAGRKPAKTLRFAAFANEEPPWFQTELMGSAVYAKACRDRGEKIVAMLSLETMGCYSDEKGSQQYPFPVSLFYPPVGNFIGFVSNFASRALLNRVVAAFRAATDFPCQSAALPEVVTGVGWSDQWSFWRQGYPGVMVTDTAPFRYPHYHLPSDTPEKVDYERLSRVVAGLGRVVEALGGSWEVERLRS